MILHQNSRIIRTKKIIVKEIIKLLINNIIINKEMLFKMI